MIKSFEYGKYRDLYKEKLTRLIQLKIEGKEVVQVRDPEEPKIINLMEALKRSVAEAQAASGAGGAVETAAENGEKKKVKASLKQAPSAKKTAETATTAARKKKAV